MSEVEFRCGHSVAHEEDCPRCEIERLRAKLAEWERWTKGHIWIRSEEYAELCALKEAHGPAPLPSTVRPNE